MGSRSEGEGENELGKKGSTEREIERETTHKDIEILRDKKRHCVREMNKKAAYK